MTQPSGSLSAKASKLVAAITFSTTYPKNFLVHDTFLEFRFRLIAIDRRYGILQANEATVFGFEFNGGEEWPKHLNALR